MANVFDNMTATPHIVAESSLLKATVSGHIYSLKAIADTDNGTIVSRGDWVEDQVFKAAAYATTKAPLLVLTTPVGYSALKGQQDEQYFYNKTGEIMRAYELCVGDIFTVSAAAITPLSSSTGPVAGNKVEVASTGLYTEKGTSASITGFAGRILEKVSYNSGAAYRILVEAV